jgi:hypothetical protein
MTGRRVAGKDRADVKALGRATLQRIAVQEKQVIFRRELPTLNCQNPTLNKVAWYQGGITSEFYFLTVVFCASQCISIQESSAGTLNRILLV